MMTHHAQSKALLTEAHGTASGVLGIESYCLRRSHNRAEEAADGGSGVIWIDDIGEVATRHVMTGVA